MFYLSNDSIHLNLRLFPPFFPFWSDYFIYYYDSWLMDWNRIVVRFGLFLLCLCDVLNSLLQIAWWFERHKIDGMIQRDVRLFDTAEWMRERAKERDRKLQIVTANKWNFCFQFVYQFISNHTNKTVVLRCGYLRWSRLWFEAQAIGCKQHKELKIYDQEQI